MQTIAAPVFACTLFPFFVIQRLGWKFVLSLMYLELTLLIVMKGASHMGNFGQSECHR